MSTTQNNFVAFAVRFNGHLCAAVPCGFARKPVLLRPRRGERIFVVIFDHGEEIQVIHPSLAEARARIACARAVKRTEECRRRICWMNRDQRDEVELIPSVARLMLTGAEAKSRRGKRWKIVPLTAAQVADILTAPDTRSPQPQSQMQIEIT